MRSLSFSPSFACSLIGVCDALVVFSTGMAVFAAYLGWGHDNFIFYLTTATINAGLTLTVFFFAGLYKFSAVKRPLEQLKKILVISVFIFLCLVGLGFTLKISNQISRVWAFSSWISGIFLICLVRLFAYYFIQRWAESGRLTRNIAVLGATEQGHRFIEELRRINEPWNVVTGIFDDRSTRLHEAFSQQSILGSVGVLRTFILQNRVDEVILAIPWSADNRISEFLNRLRELPVQVRLAPDLVGFRFTGNRLSMLGSIGLLDIAAKPISGWHYIFKVVEDRVISSLLLVLLSPLILLIAVVVKLDSPGPVFFHQKRYGFNRELINIYKYRTMYHEQTDPHAKTLTTQDDIRVTRVGSFLRRTSLDELPQLLNVVKGEMSLIGPRPHALEAKAGGELYEDAVLEYAVRHKVKPGISGWAQVNGWRGETDSVDKLRGRVEHDIYYIENWSVFLEIQIIFRTILAIFKGTNAY
jgi:Undecaprenyl-phosphate glucose phosphotransferase